MAFTEAPAGFSFTSQQRVADPFTESNMTWVEVENSTSSDWGAIKITYDADRSGLLHVGVGAASSEDRRVTLPLERASKDTYFSVDIPISIPSGSRVSVSASSAVSTTIRGQIIGYPESLFSSTPGYTHLDLGPMDFTNATGSYGDGVAVDPGGTANTKSSWVEVSLSGGNNENNIMQGDSLPEEYAYLGFILYDNAVGAQTTQTRKWDLAHGAASSEVLIHEDIEDRITVSEVGLLSQSILWVPWGRSSGDRISARMESSIIDATDRIGGVMMVGLR